jgi:hypothetical protein
MAAPNPKSELRTPKPCGPELEEDFGFRISNFEFRISFAIMAVFLVPGLLDADQPRLPPQHSAHDIRLTLRARRALAEDSELVRYTLCVTVRQGIATLWGRLPNDVLAERAVQTVRRVPGVFQALSELTIGPVEPARDETPKLPGSIALPPVDGPPNRRDPRSRGVSASNPRLPLPSLAEMGRPELRNEKLGETTPPAVLLAPRALQKQEGTASAIARLIASDVRFAGLQSDEREGVVTLSGSVAHMDHVLELARHVARVPGVSQVVVESVRVTVR